MSGPDPSGAALERYEPVIGLEVHVQLATASKIFCRCSTRFGAAANSNTCPVCVGLPGALPVLNRRVVELAMRLALALGCAVHTRSIFARKNYFYPDLPKGYQISQYELPLATGGAVRFRLDDGAECAVQLTRIHLEEDAGKLIHAADGSSLVDLNRAGVPLIEVVSEPDIRSPRAANLYLQHLRQLVRWLAVSDGNMEEGSLRCDANVSLRPRGARALGTKTEIKNLNSFRNVERGLAYEIERQAAVLDRGASVAQETMLWDADRELSRPMRSKEEAHDYRYFPEPDLPPLAVSGSWIDEVRAALPELPAAREARYLTGLGLTPDDARALVASRELGDYFEETLAGHDDPKRVANWIMTEVMASLKERGESIEAFPVRPAALAGLLDRLADGTLSGRMAKEVYAEMVASGRPAPAIIEERGLEQISDTDQIRTHIRAVIDGHPDQLQQYLGGKDSLLQFFMGQLMKRTRGQVNPQGARAVLREELEARR